MQLAMFLCLLCVSTTLHAQAADMGEAFDYLVMKSIDCSIDHHYAEAESAAVSLIRLYPESPAGYFYRAGVINSMMLDYEECVRENDFYYYLEQASARAEAGVETDPDDPWNRFYLGGAAAYLAFYHTRNSRFFPAFTNGLKAIKQLKKAVELDSTLYDAYLGLGNYMYWLSRRTEFLEWMPFISDKRQEGIEMMYLAVEKGKYSRETAASSLAWVLIDADRFQEALEVVKQPLVKHPDSRFFLFANARTLYEVKRYEESLALYEKLFHSVRSAPVNNHFNELSVLVKLAEINKNLGRYEIALDYCETGFQLQLNDEMRQKKKVALQMLSNIADICRKKLAKINEQAGKNEQP